MECIPWVVFAKIKKTTNDIYGKEVKKLIYNVFEQAKSVINKENDNDFNA